MGDGGEPRGYSLAAHVLQVMVKEEKGYRAQSYVLIDIFSIQEQEKVEHMRWYQSKCNEKKTSLIFPGSCRDKQYLIVFEVKLILNFNREFEFSFKTDITLSRPI